MKLNLQIRHFIVLLAIILLTGCKQGGIFKKSSEEYEFKNLSGKTLVITKTKNRFEIPSLHLPLLMLFVQPSQNALTGLEHLKRIKEEYKDKIAFIPILLTQPNNMPPEDEIALFDEKLGLDLYVSNDDFLANFNRQSDTNFIVLYDQNLEVFQTYEGIVPEEMIEFDINRILNKMEKNNVSKPNNNS